jgi:hypothetical protein
MDCVQPGDLELAQLLNVVGLACPQRLLDYAVDRAPVRVAELLGNGLVGDTDKRQPYGSPPTLGSKRPIAMASLDLGNLNRCGHSTSLTSSATQGLWPGGGIWTASRHTKLLREFPRADRESH